MEALTDQEQDRIAANLRGVRDRMAAAAATVGRDPDEVRLVAVTKRVPTPYIERLLDLGIDAIGENRPEEIWRKQAELDREVPWHMIGHFQRNKVARALPWLEMIHSVHSMALAGKLDAPLSDELARRPAMPVLLQVNVSGESNKQGFTSDQAEHAVDLVGAMTWIRPAGLMTMAPFEASETELHDVFGRLRALADRLGRDRLPELSMGMSGDFEIAIAEGATLVRIGSALFDGIALNS